MSGFLKMVESVNGKVNGFVWGIPMLVLLVGTGVLMTCLTGWFQVAHVRYQLRHTIGAAKRRGKCVTSCIFSPFLL